MTFSVALSGDAIINRRISTCEDAGFRRIVDRFRDADVAMTHLETLIHDFERSGAHPAAEAGGTWMRSPGHTAEELAWAGFDVVSHASNHALDYGHAALRSTWEALDEADLGHAGTGRTMADARGATYHDTPHGRVALVSMTTSFTPWSRAGERRPDMGGRPGVNPLGSHFVVDDETMETIHSLAESLGQWIVQRTGDEWMVHPPGLHNSLTRYRVADVDRPQVELDERDRAGNLAAIRDAAAQADFVIAHVHGHEWDPTGDLADSPAWLEAFAREAIDAGADAFINQGTHAPLRGLEVYEGQPILYDPGDLMLMNRSGIALPMDFYRRFEHTMDVEPWRATPPVAQRARPPAYENAKNPPGGYRSVSIDGLVVPVCRFDESFQLTEMTLYPAELLDGSVGESGIPSAVSGEPARRILEFVRDRSTRYGTEIDIADDCGHVTVP